MKNFTLFFVLCTFCLVASAQLTLGIGDPNFPVTNRTDELFWDNNPPGNHANSSVFGIVRSKGVYYLNGYFKSLCQNTGSALVLDTATNAIMNANKWRINGTVYTAISDGKGGFYIGGTFTRIGDSSRRYLAQINENGEPTSWKPGADSVVKTIYLKSDTLFIAGSFNKVDGKDQRLFALYSLKGDSLINTGSRIIPLLDVNTFLVQKDTIILAGRGGTWSERIVKYCFKNDSTLPWQPQVYEEAEVQKLRFSRDSSVILYARHGFIRGVSTATGARKFEITIGSPSYFRGGEPYQMESIGNTIYTAGYFNRAESQGSWYQRSGFLAFTDTSGAVLPVTIDVDGNLAAIHLRSNKLYLSGQFTKVNGANRLNFAAVDAGTLQLDSVQLSPSDPIITMASSGNSLFIAGVFSGINAVPRNGFAAIDSATNTILPWQPEENLFVQGRKMFARGDSLFVLGLSNNSGSCIPGDYVPLLKIYSLVTAQELQVPPTGGQPDDIVASGNYLYVSVNRTLRRYTLPYFTIDNTWGFNFRSYGYEHTPMQLIVTDNKIYSIGDNRFVNPCTTLRERKGYLMEYSKSTGDVINFYGYEGQNNLYDNILFDHAVLSNNKMYVKGYFSSLNGVQRNGFVALDINNGAITGWNPPNTYGHITSALHLVDGNIWFGGGNSKGVNVIDTLTGKVLLENFTLSGYANDFVFTDHNVVLAGDMDSAYGNPYHGLARFDMNSGISLPVTLLQFNAILQNGTGILHWNTVNETNTSSFYIEKASDGSRFTAIGKVNARGADHAVESYLFTDATPFARGITKSFYRLKMADSDGRFSYSTTVLLKSNNARDVAIYPNPVAEELKVSVQSQATEEMIAEVTDMHGRVLQQQKVLLLKDVKRFIAFNVSSLPAGAYFLRLNGRDPQVLSWTKHR